MAFGHAGSSHAYLVVQALSGGFTRWGADPEAAQHTSRALLLCGTELELGTPKGGVTGEAGFTEASGHMVGGPALCVQTADIGQAADVHALVPDTGSVGGTIRVADTLQGNTSNIGVALGSCWTGTHGLMVGRDTDSIGSTGTGNLTGVLAFSIVAGSCWWTITISQTFIGGSTFSRFVRNSSRRTSALICSNCVDTQ